MNLVIATPMIHSESAMPAALLPYDARPGA